MAADRRTRYGSTRRCSGGRHQTPGTRRSRRSEFVSARRPAYNRHLGEAVTQWASCSLTQSAWARDFYDSKIAVGKTRHQALRALGNRRLEVLWHCRHKRRGAGIDPERLSGLQLVAQALAGDRTGAAD